MSQTKKIKILHVVQAAGGVDRYLRWLLKFFNKEYENIVICSYDFKKEDYDGLADHFEQVDMLRSIGMNDLSAMVKVRKLIKKYKPDIVYAHSSKAGAIARIADIGIDNICIYNPHGWAFNMKISKSKKFIYSSIEKMLSHFCDKIICISQSEQESALKYSICSKNKLQVIYNGIDVEAYLNENKSIIQRKELGIPDDAFVIGMVGRLSEQKSPDIFIQMAYNVYQHISNAYFIFVGDGEMREKVTEYAANHNFIDRIFITGWVNNPNVYVDLFDVGVLLSRWEGFGLVIPEYMISGKPVVATSVDAIPNIITNDVNGLLVPKEDALSASQAIQKLHNDPDLVNRLTKQAKEDVITRFDVKRVSQEHSRLFQELIKNKNREAVKI